MAQEPFRLAPEVRMFHVEPELPESLREAAVEVFGDRLAIAEQYYHALSTDGVERGLIGPREVPRLWERHLLNCAVLGELIDNEATVVDIGSGAGLPGIPLAIARPDLRITLVEPLLRRTRFLGEFLESAGMDVLVVRGRAEQAGVVKEAGGADVVTSRAVAPLARLVKWSLPLVRTGGQMLALKGTSAQEEIDRDGAELTRLGATDVAVLQCGGELLPTPTTVVRAIRGTRRHHRHQ